MSAPIPSMEYWTQKILEDLHQRCLNELARLHGVGGIGPGRPKRVVAEDLMERKLPKGVGDMNLEDEEETDIIEEKEIEEKSQVAFELKPFEDAVTIAERKRDDAKNELDKKDDKIEALREKIENWPNFVTLTEEEKSFWTSEKDQAANLKLKNERNARNLSHAERSLDDLLVEKHELVETHRDARIQLKKAQDDFETKKAEIGIGAITLESKVEDSDDSIFKQFLDGDFGDERCAKLFGVSLNDSGIYVRQCYPVFLKYIKLLWEKSVDVFLTGNSGIGKSVFGLFLLKKLYKEMCNGGDFNLYYVCASGCFRFLFSQFKPVACTLETCSLDWKSRVIFDSPMNVYQVNGRAILISSPKCRSDTPEKSLYKEFCKDTVQTLVMDPWSREETDLLLEKKPSVLVESRKSYWMIPRAYYSEQFNPEMELDPKKFSLWLQRGDETPLHSLPHSYFNVKGKLVDTKYGIQMPIEHQFEVVDSESLKKALNKYDDKKKLAVLKEAINRYPASKDFYVIFETYMRDLLLLNENRTVFKVRDALRAGVSIATKTGVIMRFDEAKTVDFSSLTKLDQGVCMWPINDSEKTIDAIGLSIGKDDDCGSKHENICFLIQITAGDDHNFSVDTVNDFKERLGDGEMKFGFLWILPKSKEMIFRPKGGFNTCITHYCYFV
eukprot:TRINITY_DN16_c0_g1_i2.p1 TRINITY_DN16_c0_g1~~TRINITY_DN16_c0_g1_i2.p1  ORF type:complete len:668 (-),score=139.27 TRINITY_DN16_c0_g1_i2:162-2165(-)